MRALQIVEPQAPFEVREVADPEPGPGQVVIRVGGAGACHSDLHLHEWDGETLAAAGMELPFTLGHENAGWVDALGAGVTGLEVGQPVAVYGPWGCGRCHPCRQSAENYCEQPGQHGGMGGGLGADGGMAERMLVPDPRLLVPLGELEPVEAAPLSDAALTPYHAIKRSLPKLRAGSTAVVIGIGGLGHMAIELLRELSPARIVAVDLDESRLRMAADLGAHETVPSDEHAVEAIRGLTGGLGAQLVLDVVGVDQTLALAAASVRQQGDLTIVGIGGGTLPMSFMGMPYEASVQSTYWGSAAELMEVLELARQGRISARASTYPLDEAPQVYERLEAGEIEGRAVIVP